MVSKSSQFNPVETIIAKRDGEGLTSEQIRDFVAGYTSGRIPDYQMSALLMAICLNGMTPEETRDLTLAMMHSGRVLNLSAIPGVKVDKHSTGGVGDKVSLILAPLVAAAGVPVPMMSGRGLGHTGGTLDKLQAIPGFRTDLTEEEFVQIIQKTGFAMLGQTGDIVPADRMMYALRDVTGTVQSLPLICGSILSKKKAEGAEALILDVKVGRGAIFKSAEEAASLAEALVTLGNLLEMKTSALLTDMSQPLGQTVGNWLETKESIEALQGKGSKDLMDVTEALGSLMLVAGEAASSYALAREKMRSALSSGEGLKRFREMVELQGGDVRVVDDPESFPLPKNPVQVKSLSDGFIVEMDALTIGRLAVNLGAGRWSKEDKIDPGAGIVFHRKRGDKVQKGETLATIYTKKANFTEKAVQILLNCFQFSESKPTEVSLIQRMIGPEGEKIFEY